MGGQSFVHKHHNTVCTSHFSQMGKQHSLGESKQGEGGTTAEGKLSCPDIAAVLYLFERGKENKTGCAILVPSGRKKGGGANFCSRCVYRNRPQTLLVRNGAKMPWAEKACAWTRENPFLPLFLPSLLSLGAMTDGPKPREGRNDGREGMGVAVWKVHASAVVLSSSPVFLLRMSGTHFPKAES